MESALFEAGFFLHIRESSVLTAHRLNAGMFDLTGADVNDVVAQRPVLHTSTTQLSMQQQNGVHLPSSISGMLGGGAAARPLGEGEGRNTAAPPAGVMGVVVGEPVAKVE
jgi:hypothetical protein